MKVLLTGAAGFIGYHVGARLREDDHDVLGVDDLNDYYSVELKRDRIRALRGREGAGGFEFRHGDLSDRSLTEGLFSEGAFDRVIHLAAQPGVRYSLEDPHRYVDSNLVAFVNVLEGCRHAGVEHLVFASSSSVYGANRGQPYSVRDPVDHPVSLYAATKKSGEALAHSYASLYGLPVTGLRFFTVYGPWGRPDMAYYEFADRITDGRPIEVYNHGEMWRDFTYVDDVVEGVVRVLDTLPEPDESWSGEHPDPATSYAPYRLYNVGRGEPVKLLRFIELLEEALGRQAEKDFLPMQPGDVESTHADVTALREAVGYRPEVSLEEGIGRFVAWYRDYHRS